MLRPAVIVHEGFGMIAGRHVHGEPCQEAECGRAFSPFRESLRQGSSLTFLRWTRAGGGGPGVVARASHGGRPRGRLRVRGMAPKKAEPPPPEPPPEAEEPSR